MILEPMLKFLMRNVIRLLYNVQRKLNSKKACLTVVTDKFIEIINRIVIAQNITKWKSKAQVTSSNP